MSWTCIAATDYNKTDYAAWYELYKGMKQAVASTGKPIWADEFGSPEQSVTGHRRVPETTSARCCGLQ